MREKEGENKRDRIRDSLIFIGASSMQINGHLIVNMACKSGVRSR